MQRKKNEKEEENNTKNGNKKVWYKNVTMYGNI